MLMLYRDKSKLTCEQLKEALDSCTLVQEMLTAVFGITKYRADNRVTWLKHKAAEWGLSDEWEALLCRQKQFRDDAVFKKRGSRTSNTWHLRKKVRDLGVCSNECAICGLPPLWQGAPLNLELDHINGDPCDNSRENLRFLCPNCHVQQPTTYKRKSQIARQRFYCFRCNKEVMNTGKRAQPQCRKCADTHRKGERSQIATLSRDAFEALFLFDCQAEVARKLNVTVATLRYWRLKHNITSPKITSPLGRPRRKRS